MSANFEGWAMNPAAVGQPFMVPASSLTSSSFCVCTFVTDSHNASDFGCLPVVPTNRPPVPTIVVKLPQEQDASLKYPLHSKFQLSVSATDPDGDTVSFGEWAFTLQPASSKATLQSCPAPDTMDACFVADQPGTYEVSITADDHHGGLTMAKTMPQLVVDADRLPCIRTTMPDASMLPLLWDWAHPTTFSVSVDDDGSPSMIHYIWYEGPATGSLLYLGDDVQSLTPAPDLLWGATTRRLRVEISDGVNAAQIDQLLRQCGDDDICYGGMGCPLRVTWHVSY
jgi:hypothetical protein